MYRLIILEACCFVLVLCRITDERWLQQPDRHVKVIQGSDLHMIYEYARPPGRPTVGKLYFAHYMPEQQHENILIEAKLNPNNGTVTIVYEMFPGKVSVTSQGRRIMIRMDNLALADRGRYLTDVNFDTDAALHDDVVLSVFEEPSVSKVHVNVLIQSIGNFTTFAWNFNVNSSKNLPQITSITISHLNESGDWVDFIRHVWNLSLKQWLLVYPDNGTHFHDRISYSQGPKPDQVQLTLRDLQLSDKGKYKIRVLYEDEIFTYEDITILHVTPGYGWRFVPSKETLVAESSSFTLNFMPDIFGFKSKNMTFKLFRQLNGSESTCALMNIYHSVLKSSSMTGPCVERWSGKYNKSAESVVLSISDTRVEDVSSYRAIFMDSGNIVLQHEFKIILIEDATRGATSVVVPIIVSLIIIILVIAVGVFGFWIKKRKSVPRNIDEERDEEMVPMPFSDDHFGQEPGGDKEEPTSSAPLVGAEAQNKLFWDTFVGLFKSRKKELSTNVNTIDNSKTSPDRSNSQNSGFENISLKDAAGVEKRDDTPTEESFKDGKSIKDGRSKKDVTAPVQQTKTDAEMAKSRKNKAKMMAKNVNKPEAKYNTTPQAGAVSDEHPDESIILEDENADDKPAVRSSGSIRDQHTSKSPADVILPDDNSDTEYADDKHSTFEDKKIDKIVMTSSFIP